MQVIEILAGGVEAPIKRWAPALDRLDEKKAPQCDFELKYTTSARLAAEGEGFVPKDGKPIEDQPEYRKKIARLVICGWRGMTRYNLARLCPYILERPGLLSQLPPEIEFSSAMLDWLIEHTDAAFLTSIRNASMSADAFVLSELEREKKDSLPTPDSASPASPPSAVESTAPVDAA